MTVTKTRSKKPLQRAASYPSDTVSSSSVPASIIGGVAGGSLFGPIGAVGGFVAGGLLGKFLTRKQPTSNGQPPAFAPSCRRVTSLWMLLAAPPLIDGGWVSQLLRFVR